MPRIGQSPAIRIISVAAIQISPPRLLSLFGASTLHPEASFRRLRHPSQLWQTPGSAISRQQHPLGTFGVWTSRLCYCISFKRGLLTDILPSKLQRATGGWNWCFLQHGSSCRMSCHILVDLKYNIHIDNIVYIILRSLDHGSCNDKSSLFANRSEGLCSTCETLITWDILWGIIFSSCLIGIL